MVRGQGTGECAGSKGKQELKKLNNRYIIGTWNVRGINGKEMELIDEVKKIKIDILGITETKKKGTGMQQMRDGYSMYWSGVNKCMGAQAGVAFIFNNGKAEVLKIKSVNERIMIAQIKLGVEFFYLLVVYAPSETAKVEEKIYFTWKCNEKWMILIITML